MRQLVHSNMEYCEKNGIVRNDMINMIMQLKKGTLTNVDDVADEDDEDDTGFATVNESPKNRADVGKINGETFYLWEFRCKEWMYYLRSMEFQTGPMTIWLRSVHLL